jgi:hypothetical protein
LDVPNECQKCKYDDINVHDEVMSKIPWLHTVVVVDGNNLPYGSLILKPTLNPFSSPKHIPQPPPKQPFVTLTMVKTPHNTSGRKQIDPLNISPLGDPLILDN